MTHGSSHGHAAPSANLPFPAAEAEMLHADDKHAAGAIAGLMMGIFTMGLLLYTVILIWSAANA